MPLADGSSVADAAPRARVYYGWVIVASTVLLGLVGTSFYWLPSLFVLSMQQELGWSRSVIFLGLTIRGLVGAGLSPLVGPYYDQRHGAPVISLITGVLAGLAIVPIAWATEEWQYLLWYGLVGGVAQVGQSGALTAAIVPRWFNRRRGTAMAIATVGSALAAFSAPLIVSPLIHAFGWRGAWVGVGALVVLASVVPSVLLRRQPEDMGLHPDGVVASVGRLEQRSAVEEGASVGLREALHDRRFWLLTLALAGGFLPISGLPASLPTILVDRGVAVEMAILGISLHGLASIGSRALWGWLGNRAQARTLLAGIGVYGVVVTPLILLMAPTFAVSYAGIVGIGVGGFVMINQLIWVVYFGRAHLGGITGFSRPFHAVISAIAPIVVPVLYEWSGGYELPLLTISVSWLLLVIGVLVATPGASPRTRRDGPTVA